MNYLKAKKAIIVFHNVIPNINLNIIYCKDPIMPLSIIYIKYKMIWYHQYMRQSGAWQTAYSIEF